MKKNELIIKLTKKNIQQKEKIKALEAAFNYIFNDFVCIGGPFNDNKLGFTPQQLTYLKGTYDLAEEYKSE